MTHAPATFATLLRRFRMAAGLTQEELAERAALSVRGISDLERGINTRPRPYTVRHLVDALALSASDRAALVAASVGLDAAVPVEPPHNLPFALTPLIGRERELAHALHLLRWGGVRLLTLTGPGGVGKTRLAEAVAGALLADAPDGVVVVSLAAVRDPALVIATVASAIGVREDAGQPLIESITRMLRKRRMLLVLDNFEQVVDAAPSLVEILTACPSVRVLVTSRMPLHVRGEHELAVPPLGVPNQPPKHPSLVEPLARFPSVALFVQRAQAVKSDFTLTDENLADVAELCRQLDGLPLAIELAAAQVKFLPPRLLLGHLARRLDLLTHGPKDLPPRQRTMRDAIAWSYDLLGAEQTLFCRLAVFAGGCDVDAVSDVCAGLGDLPIDPLRGLMALTDKSLVILDEHPSTATVRFRMLETIRAFAQEQLDLRWDADDMRRRHADYYLVLAERAEPHLWGTTDPTVWTQRLDANLDNLRTAIDWYLTHGQATLALRLAGLLGMYWHFTGRLSEGRRWLEPALERADDAPADERARALCHLGAFMLHQGDHTGAREVLEESLSLWQARGDARWTALTLFRLAHIWRDLGDLEHATPLLEASLALSNDHGDAWGVVRGGPLMLYGAVLLEQGADTAALTHLEEVLALGRRSGSKVLIGGALNGLAWTMLASGDAERAVEFAEEAVACYLAAGDNQGTADSLITAGWIALWSSNQERAKARFREVLRLAWESGKTRHIAHALQGLGTLACARGELERGVRLVAHASTIWPALTLPSQLATLDVGRRLAQARAHLGEATWQAVWEAGTSATTDAVVANELRESTSGE